MAAAVRTSTDPETLFDAVVRSHISDAGVTQSKMFGSPGLKTHGKVFACLWKGNLVLKLPVQRVEALLASGAATRFDPGMGRQMKEWVELRPSSAKEWLALTAESRTFVESLR